MLPICIGRYALALHFSEAALRERARERYAAFEHTSENGFPVYLNRPRPQPEARAEFAFSMNGFALELQSSFAECSGVQNEYALDSLLRVLLSVKLLPEPGFLIHAATIARDGRSHVFMGRSGAGKSTVARNAPAGAALTDEISLVRRIDGVWHAHGTPFWGEFRAGNQNKSLPLAGIYSLVQAPRNCARPLATRDALHQLLPNVLFFSTHRRHRDALLRVTSEIAAQVPFFRLEFTRDISFWEAIAR